MKKIVINGKPYISIKSLWIAVNDMKDLIPILWKQESSTVKDVLDHLMRAVFREELQMAKTEEEKETILSETGDYVVVKGHKKGEFQYFQEFGEDHQPIFTDRGNEAMIFTYRSMAEGIAESLGEEWHALDTSPEERWHTEAMMDRLRAFLDGAEEATEEDHADAEH